MPLTYQVGKVHYSDIVFPTHPKADKRGRVRIPLDTDKSIALGKLKRLIDQRDAAKFGRKVVGTSYLETKEKFLEPYRTGSEITLRHYVRAFREMERIFPISDARQITPDFLVSLYGKWKGRGRGLYVRNRDFECLLAFAKRLERWGVTDPSYWRDARKVLDREPRGRVIFFTVKELKRLIAGTYGRWKTATLLGSRAGLRPGEMFWLEWADVDFSRGVIHVSSKPRYGWNVKTYENRAIPIPKDLAAHLKSAKKSAKSQWVIGNEEGERPNTGYVFSTYYAKRVKAAGLKGSLYTLRHTYASHLAQAGRRLEEIRDLMGHRSVKTTEIYSHLLPHALTDAVKSLPKL